VGGGVGGGGGGGPSRAIRTEKHDEANSRFSEFCERA